MRVSPFRHLRIKGYLPLPEAFRSLSRLSSALSAKASTICSFQHDQADLSARAALQSYVGIALPALASRHFFDSFSSNWFASIIASAITSDVLIRY